MTNVQQPSHDDRPDPAPWEEPVRSLGRAVARALRRMERVDARVSELTQVITDLAVKLAPAEHPPDAPPDGDRAMEPGVRSWLLADDPAQADADLADLADWLWRVYLWWPDAALSSCWLWHPEVIEELWALRVAHADAYDPELGSSMRVTDWLERHRPGAARRVRNVLVKCELTRHIPFNGRPVEVTPPGPPALARHAPAVAAVWVAGAHLDAVRATGPEPTPEVLAEAEHYQQALYRSRR